MHASGQTLSTASIRNGVDNCKYLVQEAKASSAPSPAESDQAIYYPGNETADFAAYYPQTDPATLNLLYARRTDMGGSIASVNPAFAHQLSKISLHIRKRADTGTVDFSSASATFYGMPKTAGFNLASGTVENRGAGGGNTCDWYGADAFAQ
jgi:hypothetical protein